jgi:hypothetical protein
MRIDLVVVIVSCETVLVSIMIVVAIFNDIAGGVDVDVCEFIEIVERANEDTERACRSVLVDLRLLLRSV